MGWHLPFDRAGRCLTRGQRALARRHFSEAERLLREALIADPHSAPIHMYLGHALAEQERLAEAETALERAAALAPDKFVVPLHLGIVRLDADQHASAREALERAARLAPDNPLVAGYLDLVAWAEGEHDRLDALGRRARELPESFRARLLLHLATWTLRTRGGKAAVALLEPPPDRGLAIPLPAALRARWRRRRAERARRLLEAGRFEDAADYLAAQPGALDGPQAHALLERARRGAVTAVATALERAAPGDRRALLLRRYEYENDLGDQDAASRTLQAWLAGYHQHDAPASETSVAEAAARRLAELDVARGDFERALQHCAASRAARPARETHGVEALALLGLGRRRPARHRFEDFLADALFPIDVAVARVRESAA
jgi:thioredoxin-like negative regulator of GroEL